MRSSKNATAVTKITSVAFPTVIDPFAIYPIMTAIEWSQVVRYGSVVPVLPRFQMTVVTNACAVVKGPVRVDASLVLIALLMELTKAV